ncbi:thioredoxin TrxC [Magnetospira thiophila]
MSESHRIICPSCGEATVLTHKPTRGNVCAACAAPLFPGKPIPLTGETFESHLGVCELPVLVDFYADWCAPCIRMEPIFLEAADHLEPRVRLARVDTDEEQALAGRHGIRGLPTLVLFKNGQEVARIAGAVTLSHLLAWVEQHL